MKELYYLNLQLYSFSISDWATGNYRRLYLNLAKVNQFLQVHKFFYLLHEQDIAITLIHNLKTAKT